MIVVQRSGYKKQYQQLRDDKKSYIYAIALHKEMIETFKQSTPKYLGVYYKDSFKLSAICKLYDTDIGWEFHSLILTADFNRNNTIDVVNCLQNKLIGMGKMTPHTSKCLSQIN